jgi:DUF917 family protein
VAILGTGGGDPYIGKPMVQQAIRKYLVRTSVAHAGGTRPWSDRAILAIIACSRRPAERIGD